MLDKKLIRVLILEDNRDDADLMAYHLRKCEADCNLTFIEKKDELINILKDNSFDIIISDYNLINFNAQDAFEIVKQSFPLLPFIICSDAIGEQMAIKLLKDGVKDILEKKNIQKLPNIIKRELENCELLEQKKKAEEELHSTLELLEYKIEERTKELQQAYEELKISEEKYHHILSSINDIVYSVDTRSNDFIYLSPAFEKMLGYTIEDIKTMGGRVKFLSQVIKDDKFTEQQDYLSQLSENRQENNKIWLYWFKCKDGSEICLEDKWTPIYENGILVLTDGILRNVTDRVLTEKNLRVSEDRINSIYLLKQLTSFEEEDIHNFALTEICRLTESAVSFFYQLNRKNQGTIIFYKTQPGKNNDREGGGLKDEMLKYLMKYNSIKEPLIKNSKYVLSVNGETFEFNNILAVPIIENGEVKAVAGIINKHEKYNDADVLEVDMYMNEMWKIVAHKKAEENLRKLSAAVEQSPVAIVIANLEYIIEYINPKYTEMTGFASDEVVGKTLLNYDENIIDNNTYLKIMEALTERREWKGELLNFKKDYTIYWESVTITPLKNIVGETSHFIMIKEDVTEKQKANEQLDIERDELKTTLSLIAEGVITTDTEERIISCNKVIVELFGYSQEELSGNKISYLFDKVQLHLENESANGSANVMNHLIEMKHGANTNVRFKAISKKKNNKILFIDFTDLYKKDNENIGRIYVIKDLTQIILKEQQINLSQRLESIGSLAAGIAHEINTPLQYVGDNTRFMQDSVVLICSTIDKYLSISHEGCGDKHKISGISESQEEELEYIKMEIPKAIEQSIIGLERVAKIVAAMKDFSHPGGNVKQNTDLNHNIEVTVNITRNKWKYHADLELNLDPSLPTVSCVIDEINQVILNLIVNSAHAIEDQNRSLGRDKGLITIETKYNNGYAEIILTDNGIGILQENVDRIFDPFFTTKEVGKGTGQGLAISHDIITKRHGGKIMVESEPGIGTTFKIDLPLEEAQV